ncbi:hypothetical protein [Methylogaea oryzae]|uniref:Uncharacterized protein n=1 Tax=Methylogaea oryzae TaxID=1295382 RepID=A0A8D5ANY3_9GAMM|nr:hypothetical protein [Methylogaea oryzae]BBL72555.1 hypothetical protein MoryE10_31610 [Methylogaea oryzae]
MVDTKEFLVLRYSLIKEQQHSAIVEPMPNPKGKAVLVAINQDREFILRGVRYSFVGFSEAIPPRGFNFPSSRFFLGKIAKLKKAHMGKKIPGDIIETEEDDWVPVITIFDIETQHIFVKKDWRFGNPEQTIRAIQSGLREPILAHYNHRIFVEGKTRVEHFWKVISNHIKIYKLELNLISPNILETNLRAREALAALKSVFGQDEVAVKLENDSGKLRVPSEPIGSYLEYIEEGEGSWSLTTENIRGGKKKHTSAENIDTIALPIGEEKTPPENIQRQLYEADEPSLISSPEAEMIATVYAEVVKPRER